MNSNWIKRYAVFHASQLIWEGPSLSNPLLDSFPQDAIILDTRRKPYEKGWYRTDLTPVLIEDVPKEVFICALLFNIRCA